MFKCSNCGTEVSFGTITFDADGTPSRQYCRPCRPTQNLTPAKNAFENMTLYHVRDEHGQKVKVNSITELRAAEKKYNFALAVATDDGGSAAAPPQHESTAGMLARDRAPKFNRNPAAYSAAEVAKAATASGVAKSADDTLANYPNPV